MNDTHRHRTQRGPIRAPRGTQLSARSWLTEAPLRMLMNNLDPDVAERPDELVVYGGIGRAARNWECYDAIVRCLRELGDDETLLVQSGKPVGVFRTHADAPRVLIANSNLVAALGHLGAFPRARPQGPDDVRPDDRRLVDLHRQPGHRAGHLRDLRRDGAPALRRRPGRALDPHRRARRHGRRAAAGGDDGRRLDARDRVPARPHPQAPGNTLSRCRRRIARRGAAADRARDAASAGRSRSACSATPPKCCRSCCAAACDPMPSPTRPPRTIR